MTNEAYVTVVFLEQSTSLYVAFHPELNGCIAQGETRNEALDNLNSFRPEYLNHLKKHNLPIPTPLNLAVERLVVNL